MLSNLLIYTYTNRPESQDKGDAFCSRSLAIVQAIVGDANENMLSFYTPTKDFTSSFGNKIFLIMQFFNSCFIHVLLQTLIKFPLRLSFMIRLREMNL